MIKLMLWDRYLNHTRTLAFLLCALACALCAGCSASSKTKTANAAAPTASPVAASPISVNVIEARSASVGGDLLIPAALAVEHDHGFRQALDERPHARSIVHHPFTTRSPPVSPSVSAQTR